MGATLFQDLKYKVLQRFGRRVITDNLAGIPPNIPLYNIPVVDIKGDTRYLEEFKGKRIIIVNVASECGYTPQYAVLQEVWKKHQDKLVILGVPCNQFGDQEPGDDQKIAAFCSRAYGITFPIFRKLMVQGPCIHPLYKWLTDPALNGWNSTAPDWNFYKYVISPEGKLLHCLSSPVDPFDKRITG